MRSHQHVDPRELRSEFARDYHRIINSASFRRLQDKTQVFPLDSSDFVRTRLTHSLEVSSIARSLGQNVGEAITCDIKDPDFLPEYKAYICDILQCAGLIHDIGNPPFGHFGETTIREWFLKNLPHLSLCGSPLEEVLSEEMKNDFYHFEGNAQAFRLVTRLHFLVDSNGMNLTKGLLGTIIKYPVSSLEIEENGDDIRSHKMGYFRADRETFRDVQTATGTNGARHPLSFLLEAADDIAYITADIEDAYKKRYLSYEDLTRDLKIYKDAGGLSPEEVERFGELIEVLGEKYRKAGDRGLQDPGEYAVQNWIVTLQRRAINAVTDAFMNNYEAIMAGQMKRTLVSCSTMNPMLEALYGIETKYVFKSRPIFRHEIAEEVIMDFLLDKFVDAAVPYDTELPMNAVQKRIIGIISENYMQIYHKYSEGRSEAEKLYLRLILVTDYICGMTDTFAKSLYQELSGTD